jgi:hypothetical protein
MNHKDTIKNLISNLAMSLDNLVNAKMLFEINQNFFMPLWLFAFYKV